MAAGRWLSILYGVGCHRLRWAALSILYSSKVGRGVGHRAGRCRCSRAAGLSCCKVRRVVIGAAPISQGAPSPGRLSVLYGSKVAPGSWSSGRPVQVQQGGGGGAGILPGVGGGIVSAAGVSFPVPAASGRRSGRGGHPFHRRLHRSGRRCSTGAGSAVPAATGSGAGAPARQAGRVSILIR